MILAAALLLAQAPAPAPAPPVPAQAAAPAAPTKLDVRKSTLAAILANEKAKAILDKEVPSLAAYYSFVGGMTLVELMPDSRGAITEEKLKLLQAEFDKLN